MHQKDAFLGGISAPKRYHDMQCALWIYVLHITQVGSEVNQRKKVELERLFTALDSYMRYMYMYVLHVVIMLCATAVQ